MNEIGRVPPLPAFPLSTAAASPSPAGPQDRVTLGEPSMAAARRPMFAPDAQAVVGRFFANYALLAQGFDAFQAAQEPLLSPALRTDVNNFGTVQRYEGRDGYFKSLKDWGAIFSTGSDFGVHVDTEPTSGGALQAHLTGTLTVARDGIKTNVPPDGHRWTETFDFDAQGRIERLRVDMNLRP